ncbi:hypothetical protein H4Q26_006773 [Puccinia striiformis f. sp. tritici PST-130]|nr:hypothetical protein H4Q26_006773 [Puccinia striiformis f. sp. tritici PST-130]
MNNIRNKPSLVLPNLNPTAKTEETVSPPNSAASTRKKPPLTIASVSRNRNLSVSSQHRSQNSNSSINYDPHQQSPSSTSNRSIGASVYPTTFSSTFDEFSEDVPVISPKTLLKKPTSYNRTRSGSSTSSIQKPISVRRPRTAETIAKNLTVPSSSSALLGVEAQNNVDDQAFDEIEFEPSDLEVLNSLGEGAGGEVKKVLHRPSGLYMAKKTIPTSPNPSLHRQILRELAFNREVADGESPSIVKYYGAFLEENDTQIAILMEYCEGGSLESIYKRIKIRQGRIGEKILGKVAESVLSGLKGLIKICDLGVSGELIGSYGCTFMGTSAYMLQKELEEKLIRLHQMYAVPLQPFELLQTVVTFEMPDMNSEEGIIWTKSLQHFIKTCLDKNPNQRPGPKALLRTTSLDI